MAFYWVNQGSSAAAERAGGFFWAPSGSTPTFKHHTNVGLFKPGDIVICKGPSKIDYIAIVKTAAVNNAPKPGTHTGGWATTGYCATAEYFPAPCPRTAAHLYSNPVISSALASAIPKLITTAGTTSYTYACAISDQAGNALLAELGFNPSTGVVAPYLNTAGAVVPPATSAAALVQIRIGQQQFRQNVLAACGDTCGVLNIAFPALLRASHIKPWAVSTNAERLTPDNGIALSAHVDVLFDRGLISFETTGAMRISSLLPKTVGASLGLTNAAGNPVAGLNQALLSQQRLAFLKYHRDNVFIP
ncbi:HNH endonuclease [Massilia sp. BHUDP2]|uniref:HNH endonuclease n=1 Tax=Massilia sp. BHUDP2 TaxID=3034505 RepID=UPI0039059949